MIPRFLQRLGLWFRSKWNRTVMSPPARRTAPAVGLRTSLRSTLEGLANGLHTTGRVIRGAWARLRRGVDVLALPVVRPYAAWFDKQADYVQAALITLSLAMALLPGVTAGQLGLSPPAVQEAKAQTVPTDMAGVLYAWTDQQPAVTKVQCNPFETEVACQRRLAAEAEQYVGLFDEYLGQLQGEQQRAIWTRKGDAFPKYNADTGEMAFSFGLEGKALGDPKTCTPLRVIAKVPEGVVSGIWPDQGDAKTKIKPFTHPCLRAPEWKAVVRVDPETVKIWEKRAKADGWRLEVFFYLEDWESPFHTNWDDDARLREEDLLAERRLWLWVDEVQLVIGDLVVQQWNATP
jgi:hypothetical protein